MNTLPSNKPMLAFLLVGGIMCVVGGRVTWVTKYRPVGQPELEVKSSGKLPEYSIVDSKGRTIAHSVPRFDLEMSPRSMWQVHTPERIAVALSEALLGEPSVEQLLLAFFPSAEDGVIEARDLKLNAREANRVAQWLAGAEEPEPRPAIQDMWLHELQPGREWTLRWRPLALLAEQQRRLQGYASGRRWGRALANGLASCMLRPGEEFPKSDSEATALREDIWSRLIPRASARVVQGIPTARVRAVRDVLQAESISPWQMQISYGREREYPAENQEIFGDWGFVSEADTEARARSGIELLGDSLVNSEEWQARLATKNSTYSFRRDRTVLGERSNTYLNYEEESAGVVLGSSLDLRLQAFLKQELDGLMAAHRPAMAMGIVVDVESGDVLAVDSSEAYGVVPFAPVYYTYTIGSTFKILTMASALEEGLVTPDERLNVGAGAFKVRYTSGPKAGRLSNRVIREAEGAKSGIIEAREVFAFSVNAGMAQVGLRMQDHVFRSYLEKLGYGALPASGLGVEQAGWLAKLPWKFAYTHASISFGHEITSTIWQHAAAINTVLRGGVPVELRLLRSVRLADEHYPLVPEERERVYGTGTCDKVRAMMRYGAELGTGRDVGKQLIAAARAALPVERRAQVKDEELIEVGSKTGTAQKVHSELCVHVEKNERRRLTNAQEKMTLENYRSLHSLPKDHKSCYTSSIALYAKLPGTGRMLLTYIVVEEPRGEERYGSKVAGPAAARVMAEALGLTVDGQTPREAVAAGVYSSGLATRNTSDEPWRRAEQASW